MKTLKIFLLVLISSVYPAQVLINPGSKTGTSSTAVSLEFGEDLTRGMVMPYVTETNAGMAEDGTIIMDPSDRSLKIRVNGAWMNYTGNAARTNAIATAIQDGKMEKTAAKVMIGGNPATDQVNGILVLGDTDKAMVLPKMESPHLHIKNPAAGMMAYDTLKKQLAVYNGTQWSFWQK